MAISAKSVGRVSIRVIPDATKFRNDLKLLLKRVENSMSANLSVTADTREFEADMRKLMKDWNGKDIGLHAELSSKLFTTRMKVITRPRQVSIVAKVSKASAVKVATFFAAFSGARLSKDLVKELGEQLLNLDRSLPKMAKVALGIASISAASLQSIKGLVGVGAGIEAIAGTGFAAPAIISALAVGIGTLVVALKDAPKQLASLKPAMTGLKKIITDKFWAGAKKPIIELTKSLLPQLRKGFAGTASELGGWAASIAKAFQSSLGGGVLTNLFDNLNKSITIASGGTGAFVTTLVTLGTVGGPYVVKLAQWVADLTTRFDNFVQTAASDGSLVKWIDNGIQASKDLGSSISSIFKIFSGISSAAEAAGGGGLAAMATTLRAIAAIFNSPQFQTALTTIFTGAAAGAAGLGAALKPIGDLLAGLAPVLSSILSTSGVAVGNLLSTIAMALSSPAFATGLTDFFAGIQSGLAAIGPALPAVAAALGSLGTFVGQFAAQLGPILGTALSGLAPILTDLLTQIAPLLPILGDGFTSILQMLLPVVGQLISTLLPPLVALFAQLVPPILGVVQALMPVVQALLPPLMSIITALMPIITPILALLTPLAQLLSAILVPVLGLLTPILQPILAILQVLTPVFQVMGVVIGALAQVLSVVLTGAVKAISQLLRGDFAGAAKTVGDVFTSLGGILKGAFNGVSTIVTGVLNAIIDAINGVIGGINDIASNIKKATGGAIDIKLGKLPHIPVPKLAMGADILPTSGGTLFIGGEGGRRERVIDAGLGNKQIEMSNRMAAAILAMKTAATAAPSQVYAPMSVTLAPEQDARVAGRQFGREFARQIAGGL